MPHVWPLACNHDGRFDIKASSLHLGGIVVGLGDLSTLVSWIFYVFLPYL
jgi:hypothetical protein